VHCGGRRRPFRILSGLLLALGLSAAVFAPRAGAATTATAYSPPSGAWARFESDLNAAQGLATGSGVTIALLSTGVDTTVPGLSGKVTDGPDYIFAPQEATTNFLGTVLAGFLEGEPGIVSGIAPDARILSLRTEPDASEPGAQSFYDNANDEQQVEAEAIRYAVGHGATVILIDYGSNDAPAAELQSAVSYAVSKNVVLVAPAFASSGAENWRYLYPEGLPGVIGISQVMLPGGTAPAGSVSGQSDNSVLISGPADSVPASADYELQNFGTAMGYVTGTVALIKQRFPDLSPALVSRALAMSARYHPKGGYSPSAGFGVLDPNDAILDAGQLARLTPTAAAGAPGVVAAAAHLGGTQPGAISALPPAGRIAYLYWALIALGVALLGAAAFLAIRWRRPRAGSRRGAAPRSAPTFAPQPAMQPAPPYPWQPQAAPPQAAPPQAAPPWATQPAAQSAPWTGPQDPWSAYPAPQQPEQPRPYQQQPPEQLREPPYPTRPNTSPWSQQTLPPDVAPLQESPQADQRPPWEQPSWEPPSGEPPAKPAEDSPRSWFDRR